MQANNELNTLPLIKLRLAMTWVIYAIIMVAHAAVWTWEPGFIDKLRSGEAFHEHLLFIPMPEGGYPAGIALAVIVVGIMCIPACLGWLTLALSDRAVRKMNIGFGWFFMAFNFYHLTPSCADWAHGKLAIYIHILVSAATLWDAYKIKVQAADVSRGRVQAPQTAHAV